jgi:hypothetical protein
LLKQKETPNTKGKSLQHQLHTLLHSLAVIPHYALAADWYNHSPLLHFLSFTVFGNDTHQHDYSTSASSCPEKDFAEVAAYLPIGEMV